MKRIKTVSVIILLIVMVAGCGENRQSIDGLITIDVTKSYPKKELILQDFADVEYVSLETTDEFVNDGAVRSVTDDFIIVRNRKDRNAILIFDRHTGKALNRISRQGQGPEEYIAAIDIIFDEDRKELFVNDFGNQKRILVYDPEGKFKRSFKSPEDADYRYLYNYDRNHLFGSSNGSIDERGQAFHIISKQDGSVVCNIEIPFKKKADLPAITTAGYQVYPSPTNALLPFKDGFILTDLSTDTVYRYSPDRVLTPFIVRTPSIHAMHSPEVYLLPQAMSERYYFMRTVKMDIASWRTLESLLQELPTGHLVYDTKDKTVYEYKMYNADITGKTEVEIMGQRCINSEIVFMQIIEAYKLVAYYKKGELKGRLQEIAAELDEEDNPVIMLVKHKK